MAARISLRQAALVIDPDASVQRARVVDESISLMRANAGALHPKTSLLAARLLPVWQAAVVSLEWEIHHQGNSASPGRLPRH